MAYIGRGTDKLSNIEKLDTITFDGSSSYTLQKNSVNFTPSSANNLQVSIDGVVQAGNFTVSGSTIDFGVAIPATSTNDFIFHYGTGLITTPADGTVTTAKLADASVTSAKLSGVTEGITMADQWRLTSSTTGNQFPISANWEQVDTRSPGFIGTAMSESSGVFTFPSTGIYYLQFTSSHSISGDDRAIGTYIQTTQDGGSNWNTAAITVNFIQQTSGSSTYTTGMTSYILDVSSVSFIKARFSVDFVNSSTTTTGNTSQNQTYVNFIRLGDT